MSTSLEKSRFFELTEIEEQELFCSICLCVFKDPKVTKCCRQTYCSACIKQWIDKHKTCPNDRSELNATDLLPVSRIVNNFINQLKVYCDYREKGCVEILLHENLVHHVNHCTFNPNGICITCGTKYGAKLSHNCCENLIAKVKLLETKITEGCTKLNCLEEKYCSISAEHKRFQEEYSSLRVKHETLEEKYCLLSAKNLSLEKYSSSIVDRNEILEEKLITLKDESSKFVIEINRLTDLNDKTTKNISELNDKISSYKQYIETYESAEVAVIRLKIPNFSTKIDRLVSKQIIFCKMPWSLGAYIVKDDETEYLLPFLRCHGNGSSGWSYKVNAELRLLSHCNYSRILNQEYSSKSYSWGITKFIDVEEIMDTDNGYLLNGTITLEAIFTIKE